MELGNPDLMKPYQITNLPVTLLIDREGKIADTHVGMAASKPRTQPTRRARDILKPMKRICVSVGYDPCLRLSFFER
jgi:hypothetical protein